MIFNNLEGFSDRAISSNPTLISNAHSTASCTLWWYYKSKNNERIKSTEIITEMLKILGIYSTERLARYTQLLSREQETLDACNVHQAIMQQIFIPIDEANQTSYLCQLWGEEFQEHPLDLGSPLTLMNFYEDPQKFEQELRENSAAFTNPGNYKFFGDTKDGFNYSDLIQIRHIPKNHSSAVTKTYYRNEDRQRQFVDALFLLIREDFADFLASETKVSDSIVSGASGCKQRYGDYLRFYPTPEVVNLEVFYVQQRELYLGLVQNPTKQIYGEIITLDAQSKYKLQRRLQQQNSNKSEHTLFLFSLCQYLQGYTYFDLLNEAASAIWLKNCDDTHNRDRYDQLMALMNQFSTPQSVKTTNIDTEQYKMLLNALKETLGKHRFNPQRHRILRISSDNRSDLEIWGDEIHNALNTILQHASLAKRHTEGQNIDPYIKRLY